MKKKLKHKKILKGWAISDKNGISTFFNHTHCVFMPRIYANEKSAEKAFRNIPFNEGFEIIKCEITYKIK